MNSSSNTFTHKKIDLQTRIEKARNHHTADLSSTFHRFQELAEMPLEEYFYFSSEPHRLLTDKVFKFHKEPILTYQDAAVCISIIKSNADNYPAMSFFDEIDLDRKLKLYESSLGLFVLPIEISMDKWENRSNDPKPSAVPLNNGSVKQSLSNRINAYSKDKHKLYHLLHISLHNYLYGLSEYLNDDYYIMLAKDLENEDEINISQLTVLGYLNHLSTEYEFTNNPFELRPKYERIYDLLIRPYT